MGIQLNLKVFPLVVIAGASIVSASMAQETASGPLLIKACVVNESPASPCFKVIVQIMTDLNMPAKAWRYIKMADGSNHGPFLEDCPTPSPKSPHDQSTLDYMPHRIVLYWKNEATNRGRLARMSAQDAVIEAIDHVWPGCTSGASL